MIGFMHDTSLSCPELNLIKDQIPVLGLDIIERRSSSGVSDELDLKKRLLLYLKSLANTSEKNKLNLISIQ